MASGDGRSHSRYGGGSMRFPRGFIVLSVVLVVSAACNGGSSQREELLRALNNGNGSNPATSAPSAAEPAAPEQAGVAQPTDAGSSAPAAAQPGAAGGASGSGAASPAASSAGKSSSGAARSAASPTRGGGPAAGGGQSSGSAAPSGGSPAPASGAPVPGGGGAAPNGNADVGITASSIKVGHIGIYSGPVGYVGQNLSLAARATLQSINDAGGINGRKLDVLVRDDGWDGTKGINAARDLVEREKVFAICCTQSVSTTDPLTPYADQQKVPNVGPDGWGHAGPGGGRVRPKRRQRVARARHCSPQTPRPSGRAPPGKG